MNKPQERKGKIIFIDAKNELRIERANAWLESKHIQKISDTYWQFADVENFARVVSNSGVLSQNNGNLSVQLYVKQIDNVAPQDLGFLLADIKNGQQQINTSLDKLFVQLKEIGIEV